MSRHEEVLTAGKVEAPVRAGTLVFGVAIFLGAFLLFQVQPIMGKYVLPWFGGGPAVWTACMLFFQAALMAGYAYAHFLSSWWRPRAQAGIHVALLLAAFVFLPVRPDASWKPPDDSAPTSRILALLLFNVGLPYTLLSATGPLLQRWFASLHYNRSPYRLYALSNAASLLALVSYPVLVEPVLPLGWQSLVWSGGFVAFALACSLTALAFAKGVPAPGAANSNGPDDPHDEEDARPGTGLILFWLALAACGSTLLIATTNQLCLEIASTPFLWVLPLALYLLSFILVFDHPRWHGRRWLGFAVAALVPVACAVAAAGLNVSLWIHIVAYSLALFVCCLACHGELAASKPHPRHLTTFYLMIAAGGALGGAFVALVAPRLFARYDEFPLALAAACLLMVAGWRWEAARLGFRFVWPRGPAALLIAAGSALVMIATSGNADVLASYRNFYGILQVSEREDLDAPKRLLTHGRITHGFQFLTEGKRALPTTYFSRISGVGLAIENHPRRSGNGGTGNGPMKIGVIGLGAGTLAAYGRPGDTIRFYEINPQVDEISQRFFTYRRDSAARVEVVLGDARVRLEQEAARGQLQAFDILAVDAFSSDAIPTHLLTAECMDVYRAHLRPDGALLLHISNRSLDLLPVALGMAERAGWRAVRVQSSGNLPLGAYAANWVIVTANEALLREPDIAQAASPGSSRPAIVWTDDFASLWQVFKF